MNKNLTKNNNKVLLALYQNNGKRELVLYTVPHMCLCVFIDKIFLQTMTKTFHHILWLVSIEPGLDDVIIRGMGQDVYFCPLHHHCHSGCKLHEVTGCKSVGDGK